MKQTNNNKKELTPHLSWRGPQPDNQVEAYALAMIVRVFDCSGVTVDRRSPGQKPSALTRTNFNTVSSVYAFCRNMIRESAPVTQREMLKMVREQDSDEVWEWVADNPDKVNEARVDLFDMIDAPGNPGFICYG
jgi:hypothetical protein